MRRRVRCGVAMAVMIACVALASAQSAGDPAQGQLAGTGCLGIPVAACLNSLRATMRLDEGLLAAAMARRHRVDVNGRPLAGGGLVTLNARLPGHGETFVWLLRLNPDDTVASVESNLLGDLVPAKTEVAYDQTALYDIVWRILGRRCAGLSRLALYQFFENAVKPRLAAQRQDLSSGLLGRHRVTARAADVPYCGARFTYTSHVEWTGAKAMEAGRNPAGFWSIEVK